jgi:ABC-type lipoprotein export system ATPase subunit
MSPHPATTDPGPGRALPDLVICERVAHTYGTGVTAVVAVHEVTCRVLPGTRVAVTGPSGSGKSTLLHLLAGLETATTGSLSWPGLGGHPLAHPGRVGIIFQGPSLLPALDALENVTFPLLLADVPEDEAGELAWGAMRRLRITDLAGKLPQELSGGQAQRVAVARVLAADPALILADEPTGQLDHHAAALVLDVLLQAADELGAGLMVATHDPVIAARLPEQWTMVDGRLLRPTLTPTVTPTAAAGTGVRS